MATAVMRVPTIFTAVDRFSGVVSKMTAGTAAFGQTAQAAAMRASRGFNRAGTTMLYTGAAIATGLGYTVNEAMKYEKAIASLAAVTGTQTGAMNSQIEGLAKDSKRSAIEVAKSFEIVGSKMSEYLDNPEALKKITGASILMAEAANMKLEPAIESLTGVLNIFGKSAEDANYIVNKLSAGEIVGSISIQETSDVLRQFGATARLANVQVDESVALIQALTKSLGIEGVGRGIRNLMVDLNMVGAFDKNKTKALQKAGVDMSVLGNKSLDLVTRLKELKKLEGNSAAMGMFFKKTGIQTGATLFQNFDDYERFLLAIQNTNKAQEQADKNNATLAVRLRRLKDSVSNLAIKLGDELLPIVSNFVDKLIPAIQSATEWSKRNEGLATVLSRVAVSLLILGAVAKVGAVLFYGLAKAIQFVRFVTATTAAVTAFYEGVMLTTALTGQGLAVVLWEVAAAFLATAGPVILIVAALGFLAYKMFDLMEVSDDYVSKNVTGLDKSNQAWKNSTSVQAAEMAKQKQLMETHNPQASMAARNSKMLSQFNLTKEKVKAAELQNAKLPANQRLSSDAIRYQVSQGDYDFEDPRFKSKVAPASDAKTPKNLSGMKAFVGGKFMNGSTNGNNSKGELTININDPGSNVKSVDKSSTNGIPVKLSKTGGNR